MPLDFFSRIVPCGLETTTGADKEGVRASEHTAIGCIADRVSMHSAWGPAVLQTRPPTTRSSDLKSIFDQQLFDKVTWFTAAAVGRALGYDQLICCRSVREVCQCGSANLDGHNHQPMDLSCLSTDGAICPETLLLMLQDLSATAR